MTLIRDVMSSPVVAITADASPAEAAGLMREAGFTTLPVLDENGQLAGLVTEADLARAYFASPARRASTPEDGVLLSGGRTVGALMRAPATSVTSDSTVPEAAAVLLDSHQRCLPVVDGGRMVGIVSWRDIVGLLARR
ncbi:CBS domain-containing protein [Qaidamihabitans albus]|uniref:CBS domain-containing protein n=1 Tax=Qaidamihabitans albus TaxID=2795733 RepID=UPI0018F1984A|nr:CBS domain-containing protein [Qaidamihabitans albus]